MLISGYFFGQAVRGTFVYHSIMQAKAAEARVPTHGAPRGQVPSSYDFKLALGIAGVIIVGAVLSPLVYIGAVGPDTTVVAGAQLPERFTEQIRGLGVLEQGEAIRFFYSDALLDIEDGFCLLTDRKVLIYSNTLEEPSVVIPFDQIADIETEPSDSFFIDTQVTLTLTSGEVVWFPLPTENKRDEEFIRVLEECLPEERPVQDPARTEDPISERP